MNRSTEEEERPKDAAAEAKRADRLARRTEPLVSREHPDWQRLADAIRRQAAASVELDAPEAVFASLADQATALAEAMEAEARGKRVALVESEWKKRGEGMDYLPFSPIMGKLNPASYGIKLHAEGEVAVSEIRLDETVEGGTGLVHGGVIAAIYDEVLAAANILRQVGGPTGKLSIKYRKPTPLYDLLRFEGWVERIDGRKILTRGRCLVGGQVVTEAEALFVSFDLDPKASDWHLREK
ncbi:MAG: PaaI family thioesterase [Myxococcota bacterium]